VKNLTLISWVLGFGFVTQVLGLGLGAQVVVNITGTDVSVCVLCVCVWWRAQVEFVCGDAAEGTRRRPEHTATSRREETDGKASTKRRQRQPLSVSIHHPWLPHENRISVSKPQTPVQTQKRSDQQCWGWYETEAGSTGPAESAKPIRSKKPAEYRPKSSQSQCQRGS